MQCKISVVNGKKTLVPLDMDWKGPAQMCSCTIEQHGLYCVIRTAFGSAFRIQSKYLQTFVR